jgi:molybdopterin-binding protein
MAGVDEHELQRGGDGHQQQRGARPVQGDASLVGKRRRARGRRLAEAGSVGLAPNRPTQEDEVALSARNQLQGTVRSVKLGTVMAEVMVDVGGNEIVSAITRGSAERLGLSEGSPVTVVIKATEVLLATDDA